MHELTLDDARASIDRLKLPGFVKVQIIQDVDLPLLRLSIPWQDRGMPRQRSATTAFSLKQVSSAPHLEWYLQRLIDTLWKTLLWSGDDQAYFEGHVPEVSKKPPPRSKVYP